MLKPSLEGTESVSTSYEVRTKYPECWQFDFNAKIKALKYWGRMEFLILASQALYSIYLRLKTDWKTNSIVDNQMFYQELQKLYKISQGIVLKENWSCRYSLPNLKDLNCHSRLKTCISSNKKKNKVWKTLKITSLFFFCRGLKRSKWAQ